ncbi:leucyl aminopeptidase [bacterium]|nr:leucyl aminopeptidase [bacterium]
MDIKVVSKASSRSGSDLTCHFLRNGNGFHAAASSVDKAAIASGKGMFVGASDGGVVLCPVINVLGASLYPDEALRTAGGRTVLHAVQNGGSHLIWELDGELEENDFRLLIEGAMFADYEFTSYRSNSKPTNLKITVVAGNRMAAFKKLLDRCRGVFNGVNLARNVVNTPASDMVPLQLAEVAKGVCKRHGLKFASLSKAQLTKGGYTGITAVGQGSVNDCVLFSMSYIPKKKARGSKPLCLVGKGVTFDTGGISIKPWDGMWDMKGDMGGSAAVIGAMEAIASLQLPIEVHAVVGAAENMPDGNSYRPGDVIRYKNGRTVEVHSTDAEGRLVLADALIYAQQTLKQTRIIEFSTLTGACVRALGNQYIGMMSHNEEFKYEIRKASATSGECVWELPLHPEYRLLLKSDTADMKNVGGPLAGAQTAGWFLHEFINPGTTYAHMDIAGVFLARKEKYWRGTGASGAGVRLAVELASL